MPRRQSPQGQLRRDEAMATIRTPFVLGRAGPWGGPGLAVKSQDGLQLASHLCVFLSKRMKARIGQHFETDGPPIVRFLQKLLLVAQAHSF